jgi:hypothetical protein
MSEIRSPDRSHDRWAVDIDDLGTLNAMIKKWHTTRDIKPEVRSLGRVWYRGNSQQYERALRPKVFRDSFTKRARELLLPPQDPTAALERELLKEFRMSGAQHFDSNDVAEIYFTAQHFGMPTRLLDWTMNPLIALFFAVQDRDTQDGELFVMDALEVIPMFDDLTDPDAQQAPNEILTMRDGHIVQSIARSFWVNPAPEPTIVPSSTGMTFTANTGFEYKYPKGLILPVRPDNRPGRIGQQSSCFTLHDIGSEDIENPTLDRFVVRAGCKTQLLEELRRMNINEYTIYNDLDHLSAHICKSWEVPKG